MKMSVAVLMGQVTEAEEKAFWEKCWEAGLKEAEYYKKKLAQQPFGPIPPLNDEFVDKT